MSTAVGATGLLDDDADKLLDSLKAAVDRAVRHGKSEDLPAPLSQQVAAVCQSLVTIEAGDDAQAAQLLQAIPRQSPLADWRWFLRGLTAFYRHDAAAARANWQRLEPERLAARLARPLMAMLEQSALQANDATWDAWRRMESALGGKASVPLLEELDGLIDRGRWADAYGKTQRLLGTLRGDSRQVKLQLTRVIYRQLVEGAQSLVARDGPVKHIGKLIRLLEPLPIDPQWHRLWAMAYDRAGAPLEQSTVHWRRYLESLSGCACLPPEQIGMAKAMVANHLVHRYLDQAERDLNRAKWVEAARELFRESLGYRPDHLATYEIMFEGLKLLHDDLRAAEIGSEILSRFPDHLPALQFLSLHAVRTGRAHEAIAWAQRGRQLRPLDQQWIDLHGAIHKAAARECALKKQWDEGRRQIAQAAEANPKILLNYDHQVFQAVFAWKAGQESEASQRLARAEEMAPDRAAVMLCAAIESQRFKLSKDRVKTFEAGLAAELKGRVRGPAVGELSRLMYAFLKTNIRYPGLHKHVGQLMRYIGRASRIHLSLDELRHACLFVNLADFESNLQEKLARRGTRQHPEAPLFWYLTGESEISKGPLECDGKFALKCLEKASELIEASPNCPDAPLLNEIRESITFLRDRIEEMTVPPSRGGPFAAGLDLEDMIGAFQAMCESMGVSPEGVLDDAEGEFPQELLNQMRGLFQHKRKGKR